MIVPEKFQFQWNTNCTYICTGCLEKNVVCSRNLSTNQHL